MHAGRAVMVLLVVALAGCQREFADISAVRYQVVDEGRQRGDCRLCISPLPDSSCGQDGGQPAELRWHLPLATDTGHLRIRAMRMGNAILDIPITGPAGRAAVPVTLQPDDRVALVDADASRELMFISVGESMGCNLPSPVTASR